MSTDSTGGETGANGGSETGLTDPAALDRTEPAAPLDFSGEAITVGRFRLEARIGSGGMADVHRAYDPLLERIVALKVLHTEVLVDEARQRRRILREARAAAALTHPNTVTIFEVGEADGQVFIAMELLEGEVLRAVLERKTPLELKLRWLLDAARALEAAHKRGLVHRDVKPENMFVCRDGTLKLLDFGIAKRNKDDGAGDGDSALGPSSLRTAAGRRAGTPRYMAPEQKAGAPTDSRSDQYAWGLVALETLTGSDATAWLSGLEDDDDAYERRVARLCEVPALDEQLARAIARSLQRDQDDRFESMAPICARLEEALNPGAEGRSLARSPETTLGGRRSWRLAAAVAATLTILLGGAWVFRYLSRARQVASSAAVSYASPATCTVGGSRAYPASSTDRMTVTAGRLVLQRAGDPPQEDGRSKKTYEIESDGRLERFEPLAAPIMANVAMESSKLHGGVINGKAMVVLHGDALLSVLEANGDNQTGRRMGQLFPRPLDAIATTSFRRSLVILSTGHEVTQDVNAPTKAAPESGWVGVLLLTEQAGRREHVISPGGPTNAPAIAATDERIGVTFSRGAESIRFAYVNELAQVTGDVMTVASTDAESAVAFWRESPVVFWAQNLDGTRRLFSASLEPGAKQFEAPTIVSDDAIGAYRPVSARLPSGGFAVTWVATRDGKLVLRTATVHARGALSTPIDVATGSGFRALQASPGATGLDVAWIDDGDHFVRATSVHCAP